MTCLEFTAVYLARKAHEGLLRVAMKPTATGLQAEYRVQWWASILSLVVPASVEASSALEAEQFMHRRQDRLRAERLGYAKERLIEFPPPE